MADASNSSSGGSTASSVDSVFNPNVGYLNAESRRTLTSPVFQVGPSSVPVPRDTVLKRMMLKLIASFSVTYASGSPVTSELGVFDRVCSNIELNVNGNRIIKSVRPALARLHNIVLAGEIPRRAYSTSAGSPAQTRASREWFAGTVAYPATTQFMLFNEVIELNFENPWGYGGSRKVSELDIRDVSSCDLKFSWLPVTNVQRDGVGATVTYGSPVIQVNPMIIENRARPRPQPGDVLFDYVETSFARTYTGAARSQQIDLQTGNHLMGIGIFCRNGDTFQTPQENLLTNIALYINGATAIQGPMSQQDLQDENEIRFGINDYLGLADYNATIASTADAHPMRGFAMMNLVRNGDWSTAINTSRQAGVDSVKLQFDTPSSAAAQDAATYTNPLEVTAHTHEIRPFAYTR